MSGVKVSTHWLREPLMYLAMFCGLLVLLVAFFSFLGMKGGV
jgi:hypothetical protein